MDPRRGPSTDYWRRRGWPGWVCHHRICRRRVRHNSSYAAKYISARLASLKKFSRVVCLSDSRGKYAELCTRRERSNLVPSECPFTEYIRGMSQRLINRLTATLKRNLFRCSVEVINRHGGVSHRSARSLRPFENDQ